MKPEALLVALILWLTASPASAQSRYRIEELSRCSPGFGSESVARAVSNSGYIVGSVSTGSSNPVNNRTAVVWERDSSGQWVRTDLGAILGRGIWSEAYDVNDRGMVVGTSGWIQPIRQAIVWEKGASGNWQVTRRVPLSSGNGINNEADMAVTMSPSGDLSAGRLSSDASVSGPLCGGMSGLPRFAFGINDPGDVVGYTRMPSGATQAFFALRDGPACEVLPGGTPSGAFAVQNQGRVAGFSPGETGMEHATMWLRDFSTSSWQRFDLHARGMARSFALGINDRTQVVGYQTGSAGRSRAFLYDHFAGSFSYLDDVVANESSGSTITEAYDISNAGMVVAVREHSDGCRHAVVLTPILDFSIVPLAFEPEAINNRGQVVGGSLLTGDYSGAWVWEDGAAVQLAAMNAHAWDINDDQRIVGQITDPAAGPGYWAPVTIAGARMWTSSRFGTVISSTESLGVSNANLAAGYHLQGLTYEGLLWESHDLHSPTPAPIRQVVSGNCPNLGAGSAFGKINSSGWTAGACVERTVQGFRAHASHWAPRFGFTEVPSALFGQSTGVGQSNGINSSGLTVGWIDAGVFHSQGFVWDPTQASAIPVTTFSSPFNGSGTAFGINSQGHVVGSGSTSSGSRAFMWTRDGGIVDLNDRLPASAKGEWVLTNATEINDSGQIVGIGRYLNQGMGFILTLEN
jgi:probable HAF family extracellular repeat protein